MALSNGCNDGNPDGVPDGTSDGTPDRVSLGMLDTTSLGPDVGPSDGLSDGSVNGTPLGTTDGRHSIFLMGSRMAAMTEILMEHLMEHRTAPDGVSLGMRYRRLLLGSDGCNEGNPDGALDCA